MDIFEKHKIIFNGTERRYLIDSFERRYDMDNTIPVKLTIERQDFEIDNWGELIKVVADYLFALSECSTTKFLNFQPTWSKAKFVSEEKITNSRQLHCGLWLSVNTTGTHSFWLLTDLFDFFKINKDKCSLIIKRMPKAEPEEIRTYFRNKNIKQLIEFLKNEEEKSEKSISTILNNIDYLNKFHNDHKNSGYNDFLLFDSFESFKACRDNTYALINKFCINANNAAILKKLLVYLGDFYKSSYFTAK